MITAKEIKEFYEHDFYQSAILQLKEKIESLSFSDDDFQMYNIFSKMVNNSGFELQQLQDEITKNIDHLINYAKLRIFYPNNEDDFLEGYENEEQPRLISSSFSQLILIQLTIEYLFITQKTRKEFTQFLKQQKTPAVKRFIDEIYDIYSKSNNI